MREIVRGQLVPNNPELADLDCPSNTDGPYSPADKERWLTVVEKLLSRGNNPKAIRRITGIPYKTCRLMVAEVQARWSCETTPGQYNVRKEELWQECNAIKEAAWRQLEQLSPDAAPTTRMNWLKLILAANARQTMSLGVTYIGRVEDLAGRRDDLPKLTENELEVIGSDIAKRLTQDEA